MREKSEQLSIAARRKKLGTDKQRGTALLHCGACTDGGADCGPIANVNNVIDQETNIMMSYGKNRAGPLRTLVTFAAMALGASGALHAQADLSYSNYGRVNSTVGNSIDLALGDGALSEVDWATGLPGFGVSRVNRLGVSRWKWNFDVTAIRIQYFSSPGLISFVYQVGFPDRTILLGTHGKTEPTKGLYETAEELTGTTIVITDPQSDTKLYLNEWKTDYYRISSQVGRDGSRINYSYASNELCAAVTVTHVPSGQSYTVTRTKAPNGPYCLPKTVQTNAGTITYTWSSTTDPKLLKVTYPDATTKQYTYESGNSNHRVTSIIDGEGQEVVRYGYDSKGRLNYSRRGSEAEPLLPTKVTYDIDDFGSKSVEDAEGIVRKYKFKTIAGIPRIYASQTPCEHCGISIRDITYDRVTTPPEEVTGLVSRTEDFAGTVTTYERDLADPRRRVKKTTSTGQDGKTKVVETEWHPRFNLPTLVRTTEGGNSFYSKVTYDDKGRPTQSIVSQSKTGLVQNHAVYQEFNISYTDHANGQTKIMRIDGPRTDVVDVSEMEFDAAGQLIRATNPLGQSAYYGNYVNGRPQTLTLVDGRVATVEYDWAGRVKKASIDGAVQNVSYYKNGLVYQVSDPSDATKKATYYYDPAYRLRAVSGLTGSNSYRKFSYDKIGRKVVDRTTSTNSDFYPDILNARSLLSTRTYSRGGGTVQTQVDQVPGGSTTYRDSLFRAKSTLDGKSRSSSVTYDGFGRVSTAVGRGASNSRAYDVDDNTSASVWYNNTQFTADPASLTYRYVTDVLGGTREAQHPDQGYSAASFDNAGNATGTASGTDGPRWGTVTDAGGRLKTARVYNTSGQEKGYVQFNYDVNPNGATPAPIDLLTSVTGTWGTERNYYNAKKQVERYEEIRTDGQVFNQSYTYLNNGNRSSITYPSGRVVQYVTDAFGRPIAMNTTAPGSASSTGVLRTIAYEPYAMLRSYVHANGKSVDYARDYAGRITSYQDGVQAVNVNYGSDNKVNSLTVPGGTVAQYTYDATTGRLATAQGGFSGGARTVTYEYDNLDGLKKVVDPVWGQSTFTQVNNGSRLSQGPSGAYTYKQSGRVASDGLHTLTYDDRGLLVGAANTTYTYNNQGQRVKKTRANGSFVRYVYDDAGRLIGEHDGAAWTREYVWLSNVPIMMIIPARGTTPEQRYAIHTDFSGTPVSLTDASGAVVWKWVRDPYGRDQPTGSVEFNFRLPGQYYDQETGYHYNGARYYDPRTGRYLQPDPMGEAAGAHAYAYTHSDPVNQTDSTGLDIAIGYIGADIPGSINIVNPNSVISCTVCDAGQSVLSGSGGLIDGLGIPAVGNLLQRLGDDFILGSNIILNEHLGLGVNVTAGGVLSAVAIGSFFVNPVTGVGRFAAPVIAAGIVGGLNAIASSQAAGVATNWAVTATSAATAAALALLGKEVTALAAFKNSGAVSWLLGFSANKPYWTAKLGTLAGHISDDAAGWFVARTVAGFSTNFAAQLAWGGDGGWEKKALVALAVGTTSGWNTFSPAWLNAANAITNSARALETIAGRVVLTMTADLPFIFSTTIGKSVKEQVDQRQ